MAEGFADASMFTISEWSGGSKASIYQYYASKQLLFQCVIRDAYAHYFSDYNEDWNVKTDDTYASLMVMGKRFAYPLLGEPAIRLARVVIAESIRFPDLSRLLYEAGERQGQAQVAAGIERLMGLGLLRYGGPELFAQEFCEFCLGDRYARRLLNVDAVLNADDVDMAVREAARLILAVYSP